MKSTERRNIALQKAVNVLLEKGRGITASELTEEFKDAISSLGAKDINSEVKRAKYSIESISVLQSSITEATNKNIIKSSDIKSAVILGSVARGIASKNRIKPDIAWIPVFPVIHPKITPKKPCGHWVRKNWV
jgi:hypothetical protein